IVRRMRPSSWSPYQQAVVTGEPSARTVPTTADRGPRRNARRSGGSGEAGTPASYQSPRDRAQRTASGLAAPCLALRGVGAAPRAVLFPVGVKSAPPDLARRAALRRGEE